MSGAAAGAAATVAKAPSDFVRVRLNRSCSGPRPLYMRRGSFVRRRTDRRLYQRTVSAGPHPTGVGNGTYVVDFVCFTAPMLRYTLNLFVANLYCLCFSVRYPKRCIVSLLILPF